MVVENREKSVRIWIILAGVFFAIIILVTVFMGIEGIFRVMGTIVTICLGLGILFGVAYLFYEYFIKKHKLDITYVNKQRLIESGKIIGRSNLMGDLYLSGDEGHSRVKVGKIIGYCRIQVLTRMNQYDKDGKIETKKNPDGSITPEYTLGKEEQDVFIIKKGIFAEPMVVRISPKDHDELVGDVCVKGFSLLPHSEYWFLNSDHLDVRKIDFAILKEAQRGIMFEMLRDQKEVVDKAVGLDSGHKKDIEGKNLVEIPGGTANNG